ncbi:MAG: o-succinylbenzoate--CoA ligase [Haloarculaceae archaeon]
MGPPADWPTRDLLTHRAAATPERTALVDADRDTDWTYREFDARVAERATAVADATAADAAATADADADAGNGPTVALLLDTRPAFAELLFAAMRLGGRLVPLNVRLTADVLAAQLDRIDPDLLVCGTDTERTARDVADCPIATVDEPTTDGVAPLSAPADASVEPSTIDRDHELLVLFTSGTTGRPKGVRLTVGNLLVSATASAFRLGVTREDRWLCCLPMYHTGGLAPVVRSVLYGTTAVLQRSFDAAETATVLADESITGVSLVPTTLRRLLDAGWHPPDSLRFVLLGGARAPAELIDRCKARGVPVYPTYGTTETASQIATATPEQAVAHEGTVGQPLVTTDVTIVDPADGTPVEPGGTGEIVVSGPNVTPGYLAEAATADAFGERGLHTGDVGERDADGRLWIHNRLDDRIVTGGENVDPGEVVEALRAHPAVRDAGVVGLDDPEWGERVAALVVPTDESADGQPTPDELERHCRGRLAGFKVPREIALAEELPRTASGTVDRERVREALSNRGT